MFRRPAIAIAALGFALSLFSTAADAEVTILAESGKKVDTIAKGVCRVSGKKGKEGFRLDAKSESGKFSLTAFLDAPVFTGFGDFYTAYYGATDPLILLQRRSDHELFGNFKIPGTPAGVVGGGGIAFKKDGRLVGIGLDPAPNESFTEGYSFAGGLKCRYKKR